MVVLPQHVALEMVQTVRRLVNFLTSGVSRVWKAEAQLSPTGEGHATRISGMSGGLITKCSLNNYSMQGHWQGIKALRR